MRGLKALVTVVALTAATPLLAQEAPETPTEEGTELALVAADGQPDYVAWDETAAFKVGEKLRGLLAEDH